MLRIKRCQQLSLFTSVVLLLGFLSIVEECFSATVEEYPVSIELVEVEGRQLAKVRLSFPPCVEEGQVQGLYAVGIFEAPSSGSETLYEAYAIVTSDSSPENHLDEYDSEDYAFRLVPAGETSIVTFDFSRVISDLDLCDSEMTVLFGSLDLSSPAVVLPVQEYQGLSWRVQVVFH